MQTDTVADVMALLFTAYGKADDINRQIIYASQLKSIPPQMLLQACNVIISTKDFLPSVAEIVQTVKAINTDKDSEPLPWSEAWAEILKQMQDAFIYKKPVFSRPEIEQAAMRFGWQNLCEVKTDDLPIVHAQVRRIYEDICNKAENERKYGLLAQNNLVDYVGAYKLLYGEVAK